MEATGERFLPDQMDGQIKAEHLNRYYFVTTQFDLKGKTILDIASGEGYGSNILAQQAKQVFGVDIAEEAVTHANSKYKSNNLQYLQGSATNIPIENNTIDMVVSFETIEHLDKHEEMMREIKRVLKPNGILVISSPNKKEYTDAPGSVNHFHIKELYTKEFIDLVSNYFSNIKLFWQRYIVGSIIYPVNAKTTNSNIPISLVGGKPTPYDSVYDIIIATDDTTEINFPYFITTYPTDIQETIRPIIEKYNSILNSHAFRLGCVLLKPFYLLKRLFS